MRRWSAVLASALSLAGAACRSKDPAILELAGETVRRSDFERHVAAIEARPGLRDLGRLDADVRRGLLASFLEERALVIEARQRGLLAADAPPEQEAEAVARLLTSAVPQPRVTEDDIAAYYQRHAAEFAAPERVTLRQILVGSPNEARDMKRRLAKDPRAFESLARSVSKGPEAGLGGYMGSFERGQLPPELEAAAFALPEGATSEPVASPLGYHVLRVESRQAAREIPLAEAHERIRDRLAREKREAAERAFVTDVMARAKVKYEAALPPTPAP
jgi:peptidyl-prolyl cis-trans isomerase C